ncbi:MAG: acetate/propionate family kinase [Lysobacterales bacterium]
MSTTSPAPPLKTPNSRAILVLNSGSSSLKFALFDATAALPLRYRGAVARIGLNDSRWRVSDATGRVLLDETAAITDHPAALERVLAFCDSISPRTLLIAAGHRVVHGGGRSAPMPIDPPLLADLQGLEPLAPLHQVHNLAGIRALATARPGLFQVACFDTAFHQTLPRLATLTALPRHLTEQGIRGYGFHGLSYEYVVSALRASGVAVAAERIIIAHLGNGASLCALRDGQSIATSMGFSTLSGLVMGSRCGDLDPGILLYLQQRLGLGLEALQHLLYEESGLLGVSGLSRNMQDLLARPDLPAAVEAVELFCYRARAQLAALTASLGGLDRIVFTAGIGAHSPEIRERICAGFDYLGVRLDQARNRDGARLISADDSAVAVEALATDEERMIARHVGRLLDPHSPSPEG